METSIFPTASTNDTTYYELERLIYRTTVEAECS